MHLESIHIDGFGCLRNDIEFAPDKLNLIIADNEQGKSTLVSALLAAFYGIEEDSRRTTDKRPHKQFYTPWTDPERFGLTLNFSHNDIRYRLERNFADGKVRLIDRDTNRDHADEYHLKRGQYNIGEKLLGLSYDDFLRSFYLQQEETHQNHGDGDLTSHIQRIATSSDDAITSENAIANLQKTLSVYPYPGSKGVKIETALHRYQVNRDESILQIAELERQRDEIEPQLILLQDIKSEIKHLIEQQKEKELLGDWAEVREITDLLETQKTVANNYLNLISEISEHEKYADFPASKVAQLDHYIGRIEELNRIVDNFEERIASEFEQPLEKIEADIKKNPHLNDITEDDLRQLEIIHSHLIDRYHRVQESRKEYELLESELRPKGFSQKRFSQLSEVFSKLNVDDRLFIKDFETLCIPKESNLTEAQNRQQQLKQNEFQFQKQENTTKIYVLLLYLLATVATTIGLVSYLVSSWGMIGLIVASSGALLALIGLLYRKIFNRTDLSELGTIQRELTETVYTINEAQQFLNRYNDRIDKLLKQSGMLTSEELRVELLTFEGLREMSGSLLSAHDNLDRSEQTLYDSLEQIRVFFDRAKVSFPNTNAVPKAADELLATYRKATELNQQFEKLHENQRLLQKELDQKKLDRGNHHENCNDILKLGKVEQFEPLDKAVSQFRERLEMHRRYQSLIEKQPQFKREALSENDLAIKQERLKLLRQKLNDDSAPNDIQQPKEIYREIVNSIAGKNKELNEELRTVERRIGSVVERYQSHYPKLTNDLIAVNDTIKCTETFQNEIQTAITIMEKISGEVYRSWAVALSEETTPLLKVLNPRYEAMTFNENLSFTIYDKDTQKTFKSDAIEKVLSGGARDELFLAARLGIASYLTRNATDSLPIVLDEPFAMVDDEKFKSGMLFFIDLLSKQNQLIVLSCHKERHHWLKEQDHNLFNERVQMLPLSNQPWGS